VGAVLGGALAVLAILTQVPGTGVHYVSRQAYYQLKMLYGRVPINEAVAAGHFNEAQQAKLDLVPKIKDFGRRAGLSATDNYSKISVGWDHQIHTVSACAPLKFKPVKWWFPIVGSVPYLGFFEEPQARWRSQQLKAQGYDVRNGKAGAYSTLGWFEDPLLPHMLKWSEFRLADTILHELAHATLWIPGSVKFNESYANFVGEEAAIWYLEETYGADSEEVRKQRDRTRDLGHFRRMMHQVYKDLDTLYKDRRIRPRDKRIQKRIILSSLQKRAADVKFRRKRRWVRAVAPGTWNNARLMQFKTYNQDRSRFEAILNEQGGDLSKFIEAIRVITKGQDDPFKALKRAARRTKQPKPE